MKKLGAILFGIVFILGLSIESGVAQQVETVNPDGAVARGYWFLDPGDQDVVNLLNDWDNMPPDDQDRDGSFIKARDEADNVTVDFANPTGGPYTAVRVKLRAKSDGWGSDLMVMVTAGGKSIGNFSVYMPDSTFREYGDEWTLSEEITTEDLETLQVQMMFDYFADDNFSISAVQVELVSEVAAPPEVPDPPAAPDPIPVKIDYRPYKKSNPLNYKSRGTVLVVIFGSADFDVSQIDRESVRLAGVAPVRDRIRRVYSHADRARDDYHDLVLKFKTKQLIKALEIPLEKELENGDPVSLNLTGNLKDDTATPIEGEDTAVVFGKRHKHKKKGKWKNFWK